MSIATDSEDANCQVYWYRGNWFDNLTVYWKDFTQFGEMPERDYAGKESAYSGYTNQDVATLTARVNIPAKTKKQVRMLLTWNTPIIHNYWNPEEDCGCNDSSCKTPEAQKSQSWKQYYAVLFRNSTESAIYGLKNFDRLYNETEKFTQLLLNSSLPPEALDAVSANLAVIKSPTCLRLEDGSLYGFEGCHCDSGCCEGSCTHVWAYTYAIPFLFPQLERSMRKLEYTYSMDDAGGMSFRLTLPIGRDRLDFRPCVDGQYATVLRVLREYKISGDVKWLSSIWPAVKRSIEYAWSPDNEDRWDFDRDGIMEGRQHHTLDMELFGESAWLSGMYLAGLKAGAELAKIMGEPETANEYMSIFVKGKAHLNSTLYNGEYFIQRVDVRNKSLLDPYADGGKSMHGQDIYTAYWSEEKEEILYQIADGCGIDQVLAQWHANLIGLGDIFDKEKAQSALSSIYRYNFMESARDHINPCRLYCLNDESGLLMCSWPEGKDAPAIPVPYAEETMHGFEYQAACHMIQEGMIEQGLRCVRAVRERYDGEKRNPWNEIECGSNYARSMSSYALLLTYSGFKYDVPNKMIGFAPLEKKDDLSFFWSLDSGWGHVAFRQNKMEISLSSGSIDIARIEIGNRQGAPSRVECDGVDQPFTTEFDAIVLTNPATCTEHINVYF